MKTISPPHLQQLLDSHVGIPVIDVRTPVEFNEVHIPQARNEPLDQLNPQALLDSDIISKDHPAYLVCRSGARAAKAADAFVRAGLNNAILVEGGTQAWIDQGLPVERGTTKVISLERQVRIVAGSLVLIGVLLAIFVHPYFIGLSGLVGAGLIFAGATDWCGMGLLLARMPWNYRAN